MKKQKNKHLLVNFFTKTMTVFAFLIGMNNVLLASSHREAPLISNDPLADNVDVYAFRSPDNPDMATIIATYIPMQLPQGGPNYYNFGENVRYEIHIDNDASIPGDEITYRFTFSQENLDPTTFFNIRFDTNLKTTYTMEKSTDGGATFTTIVSDGFVTPPNIGERSIQGFGPIGLGTTYEQLIQDATTTTMDGETVFVGHADDPFFVDLGGVFDLGNSPRQDGSNRDGVACLNTSTIAIQVPIQDIINANAPAEPANILDSNYIIGVWASASRPTTLTFGNGEVTGSGDFVQVSRLGMPLTNEVVIPIGMKDFWNSITPYDEIGDTTLDTYFYNPELALYMDEEQFAAAVPSLAPLRIQRASLPGLTSALGLDPFDFGNGQDGLFVLKDNPALDGTALSEANFGALLLPGPGQPRSVDLWPIFHTGAPNLPPYQLATGKTGGNPLTAGKPFINNFLPNGGDMLRLNLAVPPTPRDDPNFSTLGLVQAAVLGLTDPTYNGSADLQFIPNMDGFPNGRRLEDDVTRIELQAVSGIVLAAIGLWYDDFDGMNPVSQDLLDVLTFTTGVEANDADFKANFPYVATPWAGDGPCGGFGNDDDGDGGGPGDGMGADLSLTISSSTTAYSIFETVPYSITVTNDGPETATNVTVSAGLPNNLVFTSAIVSQGNYELFFETFNVGTLASGASATLDLTLFTLADDADVNMFVQVLTSDQSDPDSTPGNDTDNTPDEDDEAAVSISPSPAQAPVAVSSVTFGSMYPIPATEKLTVELDSKKEMNTTISIISATGREVMKQNIELYKGQNQVQFDVSNLAPGLYVIATPEMTELSMMRKLLIGRN